jgi:hypothetical protein
MFDPETFGEAMGLAIREAVAPLQRRIGELEAQLAKPVDVSAEVERAVSAAVAALPAPKDGENADPQLIAELIQDAVKAIPAPKDGASVTLDDVKPLVAEQVASAVAALPAPKAGKDADMEAVRQMVSAEVSALPKPEPGKSLTVDDVAPMLKAEVAKAVAALPAPKDGVGLAGAMIDRDGALQITMTNGEVKSLGKVVGEDGKNGLSLDAFEMEYLPESHEIQVKATAAGRAKELRYPAGGIRPAGYWREGTKAQPNEAWVHDGSLWIAKTATASKPESRSEDWIIAARKGRDGETTIKTVNGGPPAPIKLGT